MPDIVRDILQDLYAVEPTLQQREAELIPIIQKLLAAKPDAHLDPAFRDELRQQLVRRVSVRSATPLFSFFTMRKLSYAIMGLFVLAIVGVGTYTYVTRKEPTSVATPDVVSNPRVAITNRAATAFGAFSSAPAAAESAQLGQPLGLGGGAPTKATSDTASASPLIAPATPTTYEYVYTGEALTIPSASVLKRSNQLPSSTLDSVLKSANLGLIDLEKFTNLKVQQIALAEDKDQGYSVSVYLREGSMGFYHTWETWAHTATGRDVATHNVNDTTAALPGDEVLIARANAFLDQYGIPRSAYGTPVVPKYFLGYGVTSTRVGTPFVQSVQVVYPLVVDGKAVVNENGYPVGLTVDIDLALDRVVGVSNLTGLSYESSAYPMVTDSATILDVVQRGGLYGSKPVDGNVKKVRIEVGTPTLGYYPSRYQIDQTPTEYLIPALVFPITKAPQGEQLYRTAIVVPLVKDLLDQQVSTMPAATGSAGAEATAGAPDAQ